MRVNERVAFLLQIEREIADLEEIEQEEECLTEEEQEAADLKMIAIEILAHFNLEAYADRFIYSPDGLAIIANCCNYAAKCHNYDLYQHKPYLVELATQNHPECWQEGGIVYVETCVGQVSFHSLYGEDEGLPDANGRV